MSKKQTSQIRESARAMRTCSRMAERERIIQIPNILLSVKDVSVAISVSTKMVRLLIASGRLKAVNLSKRMTNTEVPERVVEIGSYCEKPPCSSLPRSKRGGTLIGTGVIYSIFLCETMLMSSYLTFPESCGGLASVVFFTSSSYSFPFL